MISVRDIEHAYVDMYSNLRNYIWGIDTVKLLAELEVSIYNAFPNIEDIRNNFNRMLPDIRDVMLDDEDLKKSVDNFQKVINSEDEEFYFKLNQVREVITK